MGVCFDEDVRELLARKLARGGPEGKNISRAVNAACRSALFPEVGTKAIEKLQEDIGVRERK